MVTNEDYGSNYDPEIEKIKQKKAELLKKIIALPNEVVHINNVEDFNNLIAKYPNVPIIIDFWAPWCGPCRSFSPIFEQVQKSEWGNHFIFAKLNIESAARPVAEGMGITGVPTTVFIYKRREIYRQVGAMRKTMFIQILQRIKSMIEQE
ncbi:MAG: thioredoxin family protein [Promethearchaeota archaeon]